MSGYEELTAQQLWIIFWGAFVAIMTWAICIGVIRPLLNWRTAKIIKFKISEEVAVAIGKELNQKTWTEKMRGWKAKRKGDKEGVIKI